MRKLCSVCTTGTFAAECRVKDGRADHRQRVVYMHRCRSGSPGSAFYLAVSLKREHRGKRQEQLSHNALLRQLAVGAVVRVDLVSVFLEQALSLRTTTSSRPGSDKNCVSVKCDNSS